MAFARSRVLVGFDRSRVFSLVRTVLCLSLRETEESSVLVPVSALGLLEPGPVQRRTYKSTFAERGRSTAQVVPSELHKFTLGCILHQVRHGGCWVSLSALNLTVSPAEESGSGSLRWDEAPSKLGRPSPKCGTSRGLSWLCGSVPRGPERPRSVRKGSEVDQSNPWSSRGLRGQLVSIKAR